METTTAQEPAMNLSNPSDETYYPPCHPSLILFSEPATAVALARHEPSLFRWLVRSSPRYFKQNVMWLRFFAVAKWSWMINPPPVRIHLDDDGTIRLD